MLYLIALYSCYIWQFPPASAMIVVCEMARMSMKMHAYIREKMLYGRKDKVYGEFIPEWAKKMGVEMADLDLPTITIESLSVEAKRFGYFFFVPTLVYRDTYVRSRSIRY